MEKRRNVEIFSAGCAVCEDAIALVQRLACESCEVSTVDMNDPSVADRARRLGIRAVPAVVVDGELVACCRGAGPTEDALRDAGIGEPLRS